MKITSWHINAFLTHLLDSAHPLEPLTWTAIPTAVDRALSDKDSGLFFWPGSAPLRSLTPATVNRVSRVLIEGLHLGDLAGSHRFERVQPGGIDRILEVLVGRAAEKSFNNSEVLAFLNAAHDLIASQKRPLRNAR